MTESSEATRSPLLTVVGAGVALVGAVTVLGVLTGFVLADVDSAVRLSNLGAALLEIPLAIGVLRRRRAAWAFLLTIGATMLLFNLFAAPEMLRGGPSGTFGLALAAARTLFFVLLIVVAREFRPKT